MTVTVTDEAAVATALLAEWHDGYVNGMSPDDFVDLLARTGTFLNAAECTTDEDPGDEDDHNSKYGHGV